MGTVSILIVDDHQLIREGIKQILLKEFSEPVIGEAGNVIEVFRKIKEHKWNMIIMDINMPGRTGLDALKQMKDENIKIPVLILSMHPEGMVAVRALKSGAAGYISKETVDTELIKAIQQILNGKKYITAAVAEQLVTQIEQPTDKAPHELLSDREFQTFLLIAAGKAVSQIAKEHALSVATVSTYRARILEKMNMKTNADLINYAIHNGLV